MVGKRRSKLSGPAATLYPMLFDRVTLDGVAKSSEPVGHWALFGSARAAFKAGDVDGAVALWQEIAGMPDVGSRSTLWAWRFLRVNGVRPPSDIERRVLGAVVEMPIHDGWNVVAAYADGTARYLNHAGGAIAYEDGSERLTKLAGVVITLTQQMADRVGTYSEEPLPKLPTGHARVTALTPGGLRFGQGGADQVDADPIAGEITRGARLLAVELIHGVTPDPPG